MKYDTLQAHWEQVYTNKALESCSWYQSTPQTALNLLEEYQIPPSAQIIDVGGGDSLLVDHLLKKGFTDLSVLDISSKAISRARQRLGKASKQVRWIVSNILDFKPPHQFDFWYDRAAFHFLTAEQDIQKYVERATAGVKPGGIMVIGTFSLEGPQKCSGLDIKQYSEKSLSEVFTGHFQKLNCFSVDHYTPAQTRQNFIFCVFQRK